MPGRRRGYTLIELVVTLSVIALVAVIGIETILKFRGVSLARAQENAEELRQYLNFARIVSVAAPYNIVVTFDTTNQFYYACYDTNADDLCTTDDDAAKRQGFKLPMPDTVSGNSFRGIKLKHGVKFGTFTQAGNPAHVATKEMSGPVSVSGDIYYQAAGADDIDTATGMNTDKTGPSRFIFRRNGSAGTGNVYLYLKKDDENSYHYSVDVSLTGRVSLYYWDDVGGTYRWKLK
jgi:prepilin-type N-terminal cleavage/methylation domain-containing protein